MPENTLIENLRRHSNSLGFLRLFFAGLVIISHTSEMKYGNDSREFLANITASINFGELAVDCFFAISGYLITASFLSDPDWRSFSLKRIARIYPAFIVASIFCLFIVAPLAGGDIIRQLIPLHSLFNALTSIVILQPPVVTTAFHNSLLPSLDGSMWTISYEFRCYILILILGYLGLLRKRWIMLGLTVAMAVLYVGIPATIMQNMDRMAQPFLEDGEVIGTLSLTPIFMTGAMFYLFRNEIRYSYKIMALSTVFLCISLHWHRLGNMGIGTFGAYIVFFIAFRGRSGWISRINSKNDISYGVYLYAWPIGKLLIWYYPTIPVALSAILTFLLSCILGWISWLLVEKPAMRLIRPLTRKVAAPALANTPISA